MRHQKHGKKLGRLSAHRDALWSNMVCSLIEHERVQTTDVKAKELRRIAERTITWSTSLGDVLTKDEEKLDAEDRARKVHAIRMARRVVKSRSALEKLFGDVGRRFLGRPGGYTRVVKLKNRHGDAAPISIVELVELGNKHSAPTEDKQGRAAAGKGAAAAAVAAPSRKTPTKAKAEPAAPKQSKKKADE